jgi:hypothetical protein
MIRMGNRYNKCIYSYEFSDNHVYVGLTYNIEERQKNRDNNINDSVTKYINKTNLIPIRIQLTEFLSVNESIRLEEFYVNKYKNEGWDILNKVKTGAIGGGVIKWNFKSCQNEALKYNNKTEFGKYSSSAYVTAKKQKWIEIICKHMKRPIAHNFKYNIDNCQKEALKYTSRSEFNKYSHSIYVTSCVNKWLDVICGHMKYKQTPSTHWNIEKCMFEANKYGTRTDFKKYSHGAYIVSLRNKWINEICSHMIKTK